MELVEGETLAERLGRGPLPLDEAVPIARQMAEALEAAHEAGIIHRDLKPANVKLRPDGSVKVLDFGLAKATEPAADAGGGRRTEFTDLHVAGDDAGGRHLGHSRLHVAGTGEGPSGRSSRRHLGVRVRAGGDADGTHAFCRGYGWRNTGTRHRARTGPVRFTAPHPAGRAQPDCTHPAARSETAPP